MRTQIDRSNQFLSALMLAGLLGSSAVACTREDAREGAADVKQSVHEAGNELKKSAQNLKQEMPEMKREVKGAADDVGNAIIEAGHEVKQSALEARQKIREGVHDTANEH